MHCASPPDDSRGEARRTVAKTTMLHIIRAESRFSCIPCGSRHSFKPRRMHLAPKVQHGVFTSKSNNHSWQASGTWKTSLSWRWIDGGALSLNNQPPLNAIHAGAHAGWGLALVVLASWHLGLSLLCTCNGNSCRLAGQYTVQGQISTDLHVRRRDTTYVQPGQDPQGAETMREVMVLLPQPCALLRGSTAPALLWLSERRVPTARHLGVSAMQLAQFRWVGSENSQTRNSELLSVPAATPDDLRSSRSTTTVSTMFLRSPAGPLPSGLSRLQECLVPRRRDGATSTTGFVSLCLGLRRPAHCPCFDSRHGTFVLVRGLLAL